MEGLEDEALLEEALGEEALLEEALGEEALVEDALGEGALEGETLEEDEQTLGFHDQDVSEEDLDFLMDALDEEDGRGQNVAVVEEEEEIHMEKHENLDPGKGNKDQKSLASKTPGKSKKSSLVGAIRKSQRARKIVSFLDYGSDTEEEEMEKEKKRKEINKKDAPKSDYEKVREDNIKEREDLFEKMDIRKERDEMKK